MPELRSGLLWRLDARTPHAAAAEWLEAKLRFGLRTGAEPKRAWVGASAYSLLDAAEAAGLMVGGKVATVKDSNLPPWEFLMSGEEA
jgi:hypothetical protein